MTTPQPIFSQGTLKFSNMSAEEVLALRERLDRADTDKDVNSVLHCLELLNVDRPLLSKTKIGVAVARVSKKELSEEVKLRSRRLIEKWKSTVKAQPPKTTDTKKPVLALDPEFSGSLERDDRRNRFRQVLYTSFLEGSPASALARLDQAELSGLRSAG